MEKRYSDPERALSKYDIYILPPLEREEAIYLGKVIPGSYLSFQGSYGYSNPTF